ncbi:flagellar hook-basal body complex protein [Alteromonas macleodii]|uniref:flagellar hook-basal body complex protein n=1 Tax=Alteromonas macleodii TaxID=28108 RepID=UPI00313FF984
MDKALYTAMTAAKETEFRKSVNANNIANASTDGFKKAVVATKALEAQGVGHKSRSYAMTHKAGIDSSEGAIKFTQNKNDMTVRGDDWFVLDDGDGQYLSKNISYTLNPFGEMVTMNGSKIQTSQGGILVPESASVEVSSNGDIFFKMPQQAQLVNVGQIEVVTAKSSEIQKNAKGQVVSPNATHSVFPQIVTGALQQSNVNQVTLAMESMNLSNQFQMNMKVYKSVESMADSTNRLIGN